MHYAMTYGDSITFHKGSITVSSKLLQSAGDFFGPVFISVIKVDIVVSPFIILIDTGNIIIDNNS